jgi:serine/threonine protein kinase
MEHGGIDLSQIYKLSREDFTPDHAKFIAYSILRALLFLHSAGIVHRDLKPSNIAVSNPNIVYTYNMLCTAVCVDTALRSVVPRALRSRS